MFHKTMVGWFLVSLTWLVLTLFGGIYLPWEVAAPADIWGTESFANWVHVLGLIVPFLYFVGRGFALVIDDLERGFRKVNRHLDESHDRWSGPYSHAGVQYIYDHERNEWYVFAAAVEQWKPVSYV